MTILKKYWPQLIFLFITVVLFYEFLFSNGVLFSSDQLESGIFFRKFYSEFVKEHWEIPLWDRFISCGLPFVDATHGDTFYPAAALQFFLPMHRALGLKLVIHVFLSGAFMFIFLKNYGLRKITAFAGAVAYMTAPMIVTLVYPGHDAKMYVAALLPLGFNFLYKALEDGGKRNYFYFGAVAGFMILSSHLQTTYFALWLYFLYMFYRIINGLVSGKPASKTASVFGLFWTGIILALMIGAVQLIPPYMYTKEFSIRGTEAKTSFSHAISWGIHPEEAFSLIVPEFCGENRMSHAQTYEEQKKVAEEGGNSYWGRNPFKLNSEYSGVIIIFLSVLALIFYKGNKRRDVIFFFSFAVFTLLYSLVDHTPVFKIAYTLIPGVKMFRGQGMILFLLTFSISVMSALMLDHIISVREEGKQAGIVRLLVWVLPVIFVAGMIKYFAFSSVIGLYGSVFDPPHMPSEEYLSVIKTGIISCMLLILLTSAAVFLFLKNKFSPAVFIILISSFIFVDTYRINSKFIKTVDKEGLGIKFTDIELTKQLRALEEREGHFRVFDLNMFGANQLPIHGVSTLTGFHDNELRWFRKFRGINDEGVNTDKNLTYNLNSYYDNNFLNLAGVRFLMYKPKDSKGEILPNRNYLPRAFTVSDYVVIEEEDRITDMLKSEFDPFETVILEKKPVFEIQNFDSAAAGDVLSYRYAGNEIELDVIMKRNGIVVMTDNYFPYWHAYDESGREIEIYKAYLTFRAVELPEGRHRITFRYISKPYNTSKVLTLIGLLFSIGIIIIPRFMKGRIGIEKNKKEEEK